MGEDKRPRVSRVAIVGDGPAALITMGILCHYGLPPDAITVYGNSPFPLATLTRFARAVDQVHMRSESSGHLAPVEPPGLALTDAWQRKSPWPLLASLFDRYTPTLDLLNQHAATLAARLGLDDHRVATRVAALYPGDGSDQEFVLVDRSGECVGRARHVILALGNAGLAWPAWAAAWRGHQAVTHAYEGATFQPGERVVVIGGGMAAAHLWVKALLAGARVTSVLRRPHHRQHLVAPRDLLSAVGIEAYQRLSPVERTAVLTDLGHGTFPWRWAWERLWWQAQRRGLMTTRQDEVVRLEETGSRQSGGRLRVELAGGGALEADRLVCATGFVADAAAHPLVAALAACQGVPVVDGRLLVSDTFRLAQLNRPGQACGVVGVLARWALPVAGTFAGMKYVARRLAPQIGLEG